jgi:hypothetical protein
MATQSYRTFRSSAGQRNESSVEASSGAVPIFEEAGSSSDDSSASTSSSSTRGRRRFRRGARRKLRWLNKWQQATLKCPSKDSVQLRMHNVEDGVLEREVALRSGTSTPNRFSSNVSEVSSLSCLEHYNEEEWLELYCDEEQSSATSSAVADITVELQNTQLRRNSTRTNESS